MRIIKDADTRREEILDAAEALFGNQGIEGTSVGELLERVGIARGTLYYHFESKEAIVEALVQRLVGRLLAAAREAAGASRGRPAMDRIASSLEALRAAGAPSEALMSHLHLPGNLLLHDRVNKALVAGLSEILGALAAEGTATGEFRTPYPLEMTELAVSYMVQVVDGDLLPLSDEERAARRVALGWAIARLFGLDEASARAARDGIGP